MPTGDQTQTARPGAEDGFSCLLYRSHDHSPAFCAGREWPEASSTLTYNAQTVDLPFVPMSAKEVHRIIESK